MNKFNFFDRYKYDSACNEMRRIHEQWVWVMKVATYLILYSFVLREQAQCGEHFVSDVVGFVRVPIEEKRTSTVANPFPDDKPPLEEGGLAHNLAANGENGDLLHVWTGHHFNVYTLQNGIWTIHGTDTKIPSGRLSDEGGKNGYMITRNAMGNTEIVFRGPVPVVKEINIEMKAKKWTMIAFPFPTNFKLIDGGWEGVDNGDKLKIWNQTDNTWTTYERKNNSWDGDDVANVVIPVGSSFLYFNSLISVKNLRFKRPY